MMLSEGERDEFETLAIPIIKWLNDHCHPHTTVIIDCRHVELLEGVMARSHDEFFINNPPPPLL